MAINTKGYHVSRIISAHDPYAEPVPRVIVMQHEDDERHIVVDHKLGKIVKRFRDGESAWSNAERWARDYDSQVQREE